MELTCTVHNVPKHLAHSFVLTCTSTMMSRSSTRDFYVVKRPLMTITYCRRHCLHIDHLAGDLNVMADDASSLQALSNSAFLSHFEQSYSQERPWRLLRPKLEIVSRLISDVLGRKPPSSDQTHDGRCDRRQTRQSAGFWM